MMRHNFKYALKSLLKNKMLIFWTFAFPIILGTLFQMAFSDIEANEQLNTMKIAIVKTEEFLNNATFREAFQSFEQDEGDEKLLDVSYVSKQEEAEELLKDDDVVGYLFLEKNSPRVVVRKNGPYQTIFRYVVEELSQMQTIFENIGSLKMKNDPIDTSNPQLMYEQIYQEAIQKLAKENSLIVDVSSTNLSYTMIEFYTLIAMACLYGGILGMVAIQSVLPNMSSKGKRVAVSPTPKGSLIFSSVLASFLLQLVGVFLLFLYTVFVLHVDYGNQFVLVFLLSFVGSFAGLSLGVMVASLFKVSEATKTGILISITMLGCFLSGMMGITMKYIIDKNVPFLNKINPASMITDGFYALYYYDTLNRYYLNVVSLLIFSGLMLGISLVCLRRQKYDSI